MIFVPFTAPGDIVEVRLVEDKARYAKGELVSVLEPSSVRVQPRCTVFGQCGGCQWQHLPYDLQWQIKNNGIHQALSLAKVVSPVEWQQYPASTQWAYRNRIQLRGLAAKLGFFAKGSHNLVAITRCEIACEEINQVLPDIQKEGEKLDNGYKVELAVLADKNVQRFWNSHHGVAGFRQVNDEQNQHLINWVNKALVQRETILDLYGGSANLSLSFAGTVRDIHCVDINIPQLPTTNFPNNIHFHRQDVLPWLQQTLLQDKMKKLQAATRAWSAIIDPPRGGLGDNYELILKGLKQLGVVEVVTIGCKSDPWARDIARFIQHGWRLKQVATFDFFPQTYHVEAAALLVC